MKFKKKKIQYKHIISIDALNKKLNTGIKFIIKKNINSYILDNISIKKIFILYILSLNDIIPSKIIHKKKNKIIIKKNLFLHFTSNICTESPYLKDVFT